MADVDAAPISGCVICYQEADRIADCLRSLSFCDEVVVVDSGSTDGTQAIVERHGARLLTNVPFPGHKQQKQFAVDQARHDFVFCLDADERCTPELAERIEQLRRLPERADGYETPRRNHYLGRILRFGLHVPDRKLRLFDRRVGRWGGRGQNPQRSSRNCDDDVSVRGRRRTGPARAGGGSQRQRRSGDHNWRAGTEETRSGGGSHRAHRARKAGAVPASAGPGIGVWGAAEPRKLSEIA